MHRGWAFIRRVFSFARLEPSGHISPLGNLSYIPLRIDAVIIASTASRLPVLNTVVRSLDPWALRQSLDSGADMLLKRTTIVNGRHRYIEAHKVLWFRIVRKRFSHYPIRHVVQTLLAGRKPVGAFHAVL